MNRTLSFVAAAAFAVAAASAGAAPRGQVEGRGIDAGPGAITPLQRAMLNEKLALIARFMEAAGANQPDMQLSADAQRWMLESLLKLPLAEVRALGTPGGRAAATDAVRAASARSERAKRDGAKLGELNSELVFIPITPCRFMDTRVLGTPLPNGGTLGVDLDQTGSTYGGSGACDPNSFVEDDANRMGAIFMNVTAVGSPFAPGFLGVRPTNSANTTSLVNWYETGPTVQAANAAIVPINQQFVVTNEIEFFGTQTHIVVDIMGLFAAPSPTALDCVTGTLTSTSVAAGATFTLTAGTCPASYRMMSNSCQTLGSDLSIRLSEQGVIDATTANCSGINTSGAPLTVTNTPWCCRLPGR